MNRFSLDFRLTARHRGELAELAWKSIASTWLRSVVASAHLMGRAILLGVSSQTVGALQAGVAIELSPEEFLGVALATNTFATDEFVAFATVLGYPWPSQNERDDIVAATNDLFGAPPGVAQTLGPYWLKHILQNSTVSAVIEEGNSGGVDDVYTSGPSNAARLGWGTQSVVRFQGDGSLMGALFTGPRAKTVLLDRAHEPAFGRITLAHFKAHLGLQHLPDKRFSLWLEYLPGSAPQTLVSDLTKYWSSECEADDIAVASLEPTMGHDGLCFGTRLMVGGVELGVPEKLIRAVIRLRNGLPFANPARNPAESLPNSGELVFGSERHIYLIGPSGERHWICSERLLKALGFKAPVQKIPDSLLKSIPLGEPVDDLEIGRKLAGQDSPNALAWVTNDSSHPFLPFFMQENSKRQHSDLPYHDH